MNRRDFLRGASLAAAAAGGATLLGERSAHAFGEIPTGAESAAVPPELRAQNILEIFLYGGVSQYESFYCVDTFGQSDGTGWWTFYNSGDVQQAVQSCGIQGSLLEPFATDASGNMVKLGPFVMPLRARPDITSRMRVAITAHDLEPHEGAIPLALAGRPLGHPALAGLGAHIQRYYLDHENQPGRAPYSYMLMSAQIGFPTDNVRAATAIGMHPGAARPLGIKVDAAADLTSLLARGSVGQNRATYDKLMAGYIERYNARLTYAGKGAPLRSPRVLDLAAATDSISNADAIASVLDPKLFEIIGGSECGDQNPADATTMNLKLATHLLTHPTAPARYVCVIDGGLLLADGGGGYDTHGENSFTQARNMGHMLKSLTSVINKPGEGDPNKLDLDKTMIVLTTEFGRTPYAQGNGKGRNHWPYGYPIVFMGGPIRGAGKGVFGACGSDGRALPGASSPQENRIAALLALGIWPFASESYNVSDVPGATDEKGAATLVKQRQLGLTT
ncbi:Hypothetical protein A7982_11271 [Minicystis rosea]|nr:Hypothetical protein A7982_11271 [Minicystis rosea]